jgi:hypothetical protein
MSANDLTQYVADVVGTIDRVLGPGAPTAELNQLMSAAEDVAVYIDNPPSTADLWNGAITEWDNARDKLVAELRAYLLDGLPEIPGLSDLVDQAGWGGPDGLHGDVDLGPLHLSIASTALTVQPPPGIPGLQPVVLGPFKPNSIAASIQPPFGGDTASLPGGGSVIRLPSGNGFGGTLQLPLGPVNIDAAALLEQLPDGTPSFLAVLGIAFIPPIELSFGFSLDRVGGLVGVNRTVDTDALAAAVRTGSAGNILFAVAPPVSPAAVAGDLEQYFPAHAGRSLVGPTLRLSWLSFGPPGSLVSLDVGVIVEIPTGKVTILGVAKVAIPDLEALLQLRLDILGIIDPVQSLVSIDASLVDSHALGMFVIYGDGGLRLSWGSQQYVVVTVGGFYPGFNPEPAHLPALRRIGMAPDLPIPIPGFSFRAEGYLAITTNTVQLGARIQLDFAAGLTAHGFLQVDALVQFRPFYFIANCSAGFDVGAFGCTFAGVRLDGTIGGPGPMTIRGRLTIETFLFDISWDETFTIGSGPSDTTSTQTSLLDALFTELTKQGNLHPVSMSDPAVILKPRALHGDLAAVPPAGALAWSQRRAPLGLLIERIDGQPLGSSQGVTLTTAGDAITDKFSPGSYCTLTDSEALTRGPFDVLQAGVTLTTAIAPASPPITDDRQVELIVIVGGSRVGRLAALVTDLGAISKLVTGSRAAPALSDPSPLIVAGLEQWSVIGGFGGSGPYLSATAAHQYARQNGTGATAVSVHDASAAVDLSGV